MVRHQLQYIIATMGFLIAFAFNIDSFGVARYLNASPAVRSAWVEQAKKTHFHNNPGNRRSFPVDYSH